uniref:Uncharacterized protein n=1 Tax=Rousettus aegyptiacus TaxID=9407 RepID=A0A7J8DXG3_ROUAE|nr:hypothetical protein HJG63_008299 [Rousettus aegyptiacus]
MRRLTEQAADDSNPPSFRKALGGFQTAVETRKCGFRAAGGSHFTPSPRRPVFHHELLRLVRGSLGFHKAKSARGQHGQCAPQADTGLCSRPRRGTGPSDAQIFLRCVRLSLRGARLFTHGVK